MTDSDWTREGAKLGAPGVPRDVGAGRALIAALIVGVFWAQGGVLRTLAGAILIAAVAVPGPDGRSLLQIGAEGLRALIKVWVPE